MRIYIKPRCGEAKCLLLKLFAFVLDLLCVIIHIVTSSKRSADFDCRSILNYAKAKQNFRLLTHVDKFGEGKGNDTSCL